MKSSEELKQLLTAPLWKNDVLITPGTFGGQDEILALSTLCGVSIYIWNESKLHNPSLTHQVILYHSGRIFEKNISGGQMKSCMESFRDYPRLHVLFNGIDHYSGLVEGDLPDHSIPLTLTAVDIMNFLQPFGTLCV